MLEVVNAVNLDISIHAPREGGDHIGLLVIPAQGQFQSTPPARGATSSRPL